MGAYIFYIGRKPHLWDEEFEKNIEENKKANVNTDTTYSYNTKELRKRCKNLRENIKDTNNCVWVEKESEEDLSKKIEDETTVYPNSKECKILYAKTKNGYKTKVYEVMDIGGLKFTSPVYCSKEGERL